MKGAFYRVASFFQTIYVVTLMKHYAIQSVTRLAYSVYADSRTRRARARDQWQTVRIVLNDALFSKFVGGRREFGL